MNKELTPSANWIDEEWGGIVSYKAVPMDEEWPFEKGTCVPYPTPWTSECRFKVAYANGAEAELVARGFEVLSGRGFGGTITKKGNEGEYPDYEPSLESDVRFFDARLIALVAEALAKGEVVPPTSNMGLPTDETARKILEVYGIPLFPCDLDEDYQAQKFAEWLKKWETEGIVVDVGDAFYVTRWIREEGRLRAAQ